MKEFHWPQTVRISRPGSNIVEFHCTEHRPDGELTWIGHCNREAEFFGPWTGNPARQVQGGADTLWRETDKAMLAAFRRRWHGYDVEFVLEEKQGA